MPVNTLNKIVALLLAGGVALLFLIWLHGDQISFRLKGVNSIIIGFLTLPLAAFLGAIVDGLSEVTIQNMIKKTSRSESLARFFGKHQEFLDSIFWRDQFLKLAKDENQDGRRIIDIKENSEEPRHSVVNSIIAGSFLRDAKTDEFQWLVQHYSGFTLASSLACVIAVVFFYVLIGWLISSNAWWWSLQLPQNPGKLLSLFFISVVAFWSLCSFASGKWLYSYELATRHACLMFAERNMHDTSCRNSSAASPNMANSADAKSSAAD